ncbi:MAG: ATP-binding protein [Planctomycetota bacterium]
MGELGGNTIGPPASLDPGPHGGPVLNLKAAAALLCAAAATAGLATAWVLLAELPSGAWQPHHIAAVTAWALAFIAQAWLSRYAFKRLGSLTRIGSALTAWNRGEPSPQALRVAPHAADAQAWNRLIDHLAHAQDQALETHAAEQFNATSPSGDPQAVLDALHHGVVILDPELKLTAANGAACRLLIRSRERLVGASADHLFPDPELLGLAQRTLRGTEPRGGAIELILHPEQDEQAVVRATVRPLARGPELSALVIFEDVTQQRTADKSRNLFVAQATHELRTPLTNIGLYLERAIDLDEHEIADRAECLNVINQEVVRLGRVVEEVLSVSEIEAGSLQVRRDDVKLDEILGRLEDDYRAQAQDKQLNIAFDLPPKFPTLQGDRDKITLALHNLIGNALKYTPTGGDIRVEAHETEQDFEIHVRDNGIGIGEDELAKVFDKFYRADDKRLRDIGGSGLGLSLAREVIRLHGGDITVESVLNKGSTFVLRLPLVQPANA